MTGQRCRFRRNTLHQAAISANGVDLVVEDLEAWLVETIGKPLLRDRHPHAGGDALSQWAGRGLDPRHPMVFRVSWRLTVELAKSADVVERHRGLPQPFIVGIHGPGAAEMEHRPEQHRSMAVGEDEAITIGPDRILRVEPQDAIPDRIDQRRQCHRRAGMSRPGLLHCVDRKRANGVNAQLIKIRLSHRFNNLYGTHGYLLVILTDCY